MNQHIFKRKPINFSIESVFKEAASTHVEVMALSAVVHMVERIKVAHSDLDGTREHILKVWKANLRFFCIFALNKKVMLQKLRQFKAKHPFTSLILLAIAVRLFAVIFVPGFGSHHDIQQPSLIQALLEWLKAKVGMGDTQGMMFLSRAFYATISLFTVSIVYRICDLLANDKATAWNIALLPVVCVIMPAFGIIDNVSFFLGLPLLLYGSNVVLRQQVLIGANKSEKVHRTSYIIAGIMLALSVCIWYQCSFLVLAILLMLCAKRDFKGALMTLIGFVITIVLLWVLLLILNINPWSYIAL